MKNQIFVIVVCVAALGFITYGLVKNEQHRERERWARFKACTDSLGGATDINCEECWHLVTGEWVEVDLGKH